MAVTKRERYIQILEYVAENEELVEFVNHEIELLNKKSGSLKKPTARQTENVALTADIVTTLTVEDRPMTIKEIIAATPSLAEITNQRVTHMLTALRNEGKVQRDYIKKVAYFSIAPATDDEEDEEEA